MYQGLNFEIASVMPQVIDTGLLDSFFTAQAPDGAQTSTGAPSGNYVDVIGLQQIPCNDAVQSTGGISPTEVRELKEIMDKAMRHVMLDAYYPALTVGWRAGWRAVVTLPDGTSQTYDIIGCETDSQVTHTRVELMEVTV